MNDARHYWNEPLETLAWPDVERWQVRQLTIALAALRQRSALYRQLYCDLSNDARFAELDDLQSLPFTTKDALRAAQAQSSDSAPFGANQAAELRDIVQVLSSSGTTGQPLNYALTANDVEMFTDAIAQNWFTAGVRRDDVVAHLVGLPMVAGGLPYADGFRRIGATLCWLGGFPTDRILREMRRLRVSTVLATTSFGLYLAEHWDDIGRETGLPSSLKKFIGGGEPGLGQSEIRARITGGLGLSHLRDSMGLGDVISGMWSECGAGDGMHFNAQRYVAVELIDPDSGGQLPWREGARGELVYSAFAREATPVVRYRSRDHALVVGQSCACGRTSPRIHCIGRTDDMLIYKGMNVFPSAIRDLITRHFGTQVEPMLRIWKDRADQVSFNEAIAVDVEASPGFDPAGVGGLRQAIEDLLRTHLQVRTVVSVLAYGTLAKGVYKNSLIAVRDSR
jgi:phenylacetate-coenzyme A ligase PaaK-like adenylate-forming protein